MLYVKHRGKKTQQEETSKRRKMSEGKNAEEKTTSPLPQVDMKIGINMRGDFPLAIRWYSYDDKLIETASHDKILIYRYDNGLMDNALCNLMKFYVKNCSPNLIYFDRGGVHKQIWLNQNNQYHRENDLPAIVTFEHNVKTMSEWYYQGKRQRENDKEIIEHHIDYRNFYEQFTTKNKCRYSGIDTEQWRYWALWL